MPTTTGNSGHRASTSTDERVDLDRPIPTASDAVALQRVQLGMLHVRCTRCGQLSDAIDVGTNPQLVGGELMLFGVIHFLGCSHVAYCPHLARRCAQIQEHLEGGELMPEDFCGLVDADHDTELDEE